MAEGEAEGRWLAEAAVNGAKLGSQAAGEPVLGLENGQLDPLSQLLSSGSRERFQPSRHRYQSGGARLKEGWRRPGERQGTITHPPGLGQGYSGLRGCSAGLVSCPMLPSAPSYSHHHLL